MPAADQPQRIPVPEHVSVLARAAERAIAAHRDDFLHDLEVLVNLDSGTYDRADVERVGAWVRARCATWGASVVENPGGDYADSFATTIDGAGQHTIVLLAHLDTVFPHGTAAERPFRIEDQRSAVPPSRSAEDQQSAVPPSRSAEGDRALGPGTCDMKGGLLAAIYAIEALRSLGFDGFGRLRLVCTTDEEVGAPSSRAFVERMAEGARAVLVLEAGRENGDIVGQRRGGGTYRLEVRGRSAHAGVEPQKGRSAVLTLSRQVVALQALSNLATGQTVNVGTLRAGTRPNVVPDHAVAEVDLRFTTIADMHALLAQIDAALAREAIEGTTYTWTPVQFRPPWEPSAGTEHLADLARAVVSVLGFDVGVATTGGTSDGNFTAARGIPTLDGLGPVGGLDHGPFEYIDIPSIVPRTALLAGLIAAVASE